MKSSMNCLLNLNRWRIILWLSFKKKQRNGALALNQLRIATFIAQKVVLSANHLVHFLLTSKVNKGQWRRQLQIGEGRHKNSVHTLVL